jgi:ribonuclease VapC
MKPYVLDASALLASIYSEKGADVVDSNLYDAVISTVNLTEVAENMLSRGTSVAQVRKTIDALLLKVIDYSHEHAFIAASLRKPTKSLGLSLGDRACLALATTEKLTVLTADTAWSKLDVGIKIKVIR